MSFYELTALTAGIFHLVLTVFVLSRDLRSSINWAYTLWGSSLTIWNLAGYMKYRACLNSDRASGLIWLELLHLSVVLLPVSIFHLYFLIGRVNKPRLLAAIYAATACFAASVFTPYYIKDIRPSNFGYVAIGGPMFYAFMAAYFTTGVITIFMLIHQQKALPPLHRSRLRVFLFAYILLALSGLHDLMVVLDLKYPVLGIPVRPIGNFTAILFGSVVAYGVLQHQLLSINVTLSRVAAQMVRMAFMVLVGFTLMIALHGASGEPFNGFSLFSTLAVLSVTAALTSILFPRLFGKGEETLERRILGDQFEYQDRVRGFIQTIPFYGDSDLLLGDLHQILVGTMGVKSYQIILLDETKRVFSLFRSQPSLPQAQIEGLTLDSPIFHFFQTTQAEYLAYKLVYAIPGETAAEQTARQMLKEYDPELCFPLAAERDPFGLLLVGEKTMGEPYSNQDLKLVVEMVKNLGLVLNQIRLKKQLLLAEEMELLGTMSRGIAHDLNNLLTPISTFLQMASAGENLPALREELLPTAMHNLETIRAYVHEALFFSRTQSLQLRSFNMEGVINNCVELAQAALKEKRLSMVILAPPGTSVEMDEVLIQRLISNLLSNAIDASPAGARIQIDLVRLTKTQNNCDWLRLRVIDQGEGISPANLRRVATPYFTTKDYGDHRRGFGLGLAICRKIVHLHGGHLSIVSEEKKGTTVKVDLPDRQIVKNSAGVRRS